MHEHFRAYYAAWNSLDLEAVLSFFTDDIEFEDTTLGSGARGLAKMRRFVQASFATLPDARFQYVGHLATETHFAVEWVMLPMKVRGVSIGTLRDGKISAQRDYWNGSKFSPPHA
jgi:ketosteroid isomerase-like protein